MPFVKGQITNPGGRPKGVPSRTNEQIRAMFRDFLNANMETVQDDFNKLEPKDRLTFITSVAKLILPPPLHPLQALTEDELRKIVKLLRDEQEQLIESN